MPPIKTPKPAPQQPPKPPKPPVKTAPPPAPDRGRQVGYPDYQIVYCWPGTINGPMTYDAIRALLHWETEEDHVKRMLTEQPGTKEKRWMYGDDYLLLDVEGRKVRCWNNTANRPFDPRLREAYTQDMLNRLWVGPTNFPGTSKFTLSVKWTGPDGKTYEPGDEIELPTTTCNGEPIIVSRTGQVLSLQHRGTAFVWAVDLWRKYPEKYQLWATEPVLDCAIQLGVSDDPRVVRTIDSGKPRSESDMLYTTTFARDAKAAKGMTDKQRSVAARMLARANDLLWKRTAAATEGEQYTTHSVLQNFADRHPRLVKAVAHVAAEDADLGISCHGVSAGQCAALLYLMACSASDGDAYLAKPHPGDEDLNWSRWADAERFWTLVADGGTNLPPLLGSMPEKGRKATGIYACQGPALGDTKGNTRYLLSRKGHPESSNEEKLAVLVKAWNVYASCPVDVREDGDKEIAWFKANLTPARVAPCYGGIVLDENGAVADYKLADNPNVGEWTVVNGETPPGTGGIDLGSKPGTTGKVPENGGDDPAVEPREVDNGKEQLKEERLARIKAAAEAARARRAEENGETDKPLDKGAKDQLEELRAKHVGKILLIESRDGKHYSCFGTDAETVAKLTSGKAAKNPSGILEFGFGAEHRDRILGKLLGAKHKVATVRSIKGVATVFNEVKK